MVAAHRAASSACAAARAANGRPAFATPTAFLRAVALYGKLLADRRAASTAAQARLEAGVAKIVAARDQVAALGAALAEEQEVVAKRSAETAALIESIGVEKLQADAAVEAGRADEEEAAGIQVWGGEGA